MAESKVNLICLHDFENFAKANLHKHIYDHIKSGADEEQTRVENQDAFKRWVALMVGP